MIVLEQITKKYPGQAMPAVDKLSISIPKGEICVLVGPSGCGKSTILRMINRMIEPTSGIVKINGEDVTQKNPDQLRMGIGYVIQQIGLLPHRTIAENIAIVPRLYKWPKEKIKQRVDELIVMMGLDLEKTRGKYPAQLSGGQMQRVGVARAMAVDPPIMLMDEPFGAVDPIARTHLQDELLRLQKEIKKTIVFVTHDINEAIKMGDRIAIFNAGKLVQFGTPEEILTNPVNEFVEDFIGRDRVVKKLNLYSAGDAMQPIRCVVKENELGNAAQKMKEAGAEVAFLLNKAGKACGHITSSDLDEFGKDLGGLRKRIGRTEKAFVQTTTPFPDALSLLLEYDADYLGILKGEELCGMLSFKGIRKHVYRKEGE
ncbi:ABC transporter ATP-binding protein [Desulfosporosinus sp.]|uniref:ABC transporter ATP-binding protein n=1 Tax=Desulfosporosinus sp. TaxID=157907 RepID=UPI000E8BFD66|nr:betaine/proline/choline family ABC transporter ATP-binding protein [Desulfosporosinus sp.]MBC2721123.1 betaine/proline/choline family ABC transporter ATP-binding protein [Desulfosporosinus sp.]MBC2725554.1 betaine/proline/choline family ABC transporter ATP-binding protein [Desulfosporosinus sp.]HBV88182.1 glycine betaine ABC transporter ATP-binding protein [Desulfosporosinus sp.]